METNLLMISVVTYKVVSLLVGLALAYMGYRLFLSNIWGQSGDLRAQFRENSLVLKKAAPGTFFAVLGTVVIVTTLFTGLEYEGVKSMDEQSAIPNPIQLPAEPPLKQDKEQLP